MSDALPLEYSSVLCVPRYVYGHPSKKADEHFLQGQIGEGQHRQIIQDDWSRLSRYSEPRASRHLPLRRHAVQDVHPPPSLTSVSPLATPGICVVTVLDSLPSGKTRLEAITSLVTYNDHVVEECIDDFFSILRCVAEAPSSSSQAQLLTISDSQRTPDSTLLLNELHTIEEVENPEVDAGGVDIEPRMSSTVTCRPLTTSDPEAKYDAMLAAHFATFPFDSNDIQEWFDEVEREKQAKMDVHVAYVLKALPVPVPKLSAHFATDSPANLTTVEEDEFISDRSPVKVETTETNTSSADSSLVTSADAEEDRPMILHGLRRVKHHEDLRVCFYSISLLHLLLDFDYTEFTGDNRLQRFVLEPVLLVV